MSDFPELAAEREAREERERERDATQREAVAVQLDVALRRRDEVQPFGPPEILAAAELAAQNPASSVRGTAIPLHLATGPNRMAQDNLLRTINWDY